MGGTLGGSEAQGHDVGLFTKLGTARGDRASGKKRVPPPGWDEQDSFTCLLGVFIPHSQERGEKVEGSGRPSGPQPE